MREKYVKIYKNILYLSYALTVVVILGITSYAPQYLTLLRETIKIFVTGFLIIKFNPFVKKTILSDFDREIIFSGAIFLLLTTTAITTIEYYINKYTSNRFKPILDVVIP